MNQKEILTNRSPLFLKSLPFIPMPNWFTKPPSVRLPQNNWPIDVFGIDRKRSWKHHFERFLRIKRVCLDNGSKRNINFKTAFLNEVEGESFCILATDNSKSSYIKESLEILGFDENKHQQVLKTDAGKYDWWSGIMHLRFTSKNLWLPWSRLVWSAAYLTGLNML